MRRTTSLNLYVVGVAVAAIAATVSLPFAGLTSSIAPLSVLLILAGLVGARSIRIERLGVTLTATDAFMFCGLLVVGPVAAPLIAFVGTLGAVIGPKPSLPLIRNAFNLGGVTTSGACAAWIYHLMSPNGSPGFGESMLPLLGATAGFFLVNVLLVAGVMALHGRRRFADAFRGCGLCFTNATLSSALVGVGMAVAIEAPIGLLGLLVGLAASAMLLGAFRELKDRPSGKTS